MTLFEGILLGIIQGLTEFLPISSTAHLTLAGTMFGLIDLARPEAWTATIAVMQLGTTASILVYFRHDLGRIARNVVIDGRALWRRPSDDSRLAGLILVGSIPLAVAGLLALDYIEGTLTKDTSLIALSLIGVAGILLIAEMAVRHARTIADKNWLDALVIGAAQALALIPGASRSGTTIAAGLFLGFTRESAARFSFLLSIPAVVGSGFYELGRIGPYLMPSDVLPLMASIIVAGIIGYASIGFLLAYLKKRSMLLFLIYRIVLGIAILLI